MSAPESPPHLPAIRRLDQMPERVLYVARAGLGAIPSGFGTILVFMTPQILSLGFVLWAIWWPYPNDTNGFAWAVTWSVVLASLVLGVAALLIRRNRGFITAVMRAPFIRITVTDRRVVWTVPWDRRPLMDIGRARVLGAVIGQVDRRGRGNAAMELVPGDPCADIDGHIHFDRLPHADRFVAALAA